MRGNEADRVHTYLGTFVIALSTLALEITLTRLLSVATWYHLAFFCIATAMLGMTAGAVTVYLKPEWFEARRRSLSAARACLAYALATPISLILLCSLPLVFQPDIMSMLVLLLATASCALPFYCAGIAVAGALTRFELPPGKIYAVDLMGASLGCLLVLGGLEYLDAPSLILLCGALGLPAAAAFSWREAGARRGRTFALLAVYGLAITANVVAEKKIRPVFIKNKVEIGTRYHLDQWNSFSRVVVYEQVEQAPHMWGPSPKAPRGQLLAQYKMNIDGLAGTTLGRFHEPEDIEYLRYDVTNVAHFLRPKGPACVIGVGGGRDIQSALLFGHESVVGVDVNPIFVELLEGEFRDFAGIASHEGVSLVVDEARSYLSASRDEFSLIQMSLIDTWAATGAGAFSLTENGLYTVEAWQVFLSRLSEDGLFTVSRWYDPNYLGETGRMVSLAVATLLRRSGVDPQQHIAMVTSGKIATLIVSARPFRDGELKRLEKVAARFEYNLAIHPGKSPSDPVLRKLITAPSLAALHERIRDEPLDFSPPTDENPFFFNMLKLESLTLDVRQNAGLIGGNQLAAGTLIVLIQCLSVLALLTIAVPLWLARPAPSSTPSRVPVSGAVYFSAIGAGFMLLEIGLVQRLSVFLGHPAYALGVILFTLIASTGLGSYLSERLPSHKPAALALLTLVAVTLILSLRGGLVVVTAAWVTEARAIKVLVAIATVLPVGVVLGFFFPTGMRIAQQVGAAATPWYWALNGIFGVLCSALAVFFSIYWGIATNYTLAALCYAVAGVALWRLSRLSESASSGAA